MTRVVYGVTSASHSSIKALQCVLHRCQSLDVKLAGNDFYVDDWISGSDSEANGAKLINNIRTALDKGGFELRKFGSNLASLILDFPEKLRENSDAVEFSDEDHSIKTLGVH